MVSAAKKKLVESRHAYHKKQSTNLVTAESSQRESAKIPKECLEMGASFPLHLAAMHGDTIGIKRLLREGLDINGLDSEKRTPLMLAALFGRRENVSYLLEQGAIISKKDIFGQKAVDFAHECPCNDKKRNETFGWNMLDLKYVGLECRLIISLLKGGQKTHKCPSRPENFPEYYAVRPGKNTFTIMAPVFEVTVNNAENRTIAWTLTKGTLDTRACAVSGWSFTKYKNPPDFLLDSEQWTDKVVMLSNLVGHDLHGGNHDHGEYGRMFSSHAEKQIIAFIAWEQVLEALSSKSPRTWKRARQAKLDDEVEIFVSRIPCKWCEDLCQKTNAAFGTNMKLVFIHRIHNLADRCKCGGCMCDLPVPKVVIPMLENLAVEEPAESQLPPTPTATRSQRKQKTVHEVSVHKKSNTVIGGSPQRKQMDAAFSLPTPCDSPRIPKTPVKESPVKAASFGSKTRKPIIVDSSESSESEEEWVSVDMPLTPTKIRSQSKTKSSSLDKAKKSVLPDDDSDISEWSPSRGSSVTKRKKSASDCSTECSECSIVRQIFVRTGQDDQFSEDDCASSEDKREENADNSSESVEDAFFDKESVTRDESNQENEA